MKTQYILEPLILSMQDTFMEYREYFENDLPLNMINNVHITNSGQILQCNLDTVLHNQEQKLKLYNYLFYKLIVSTKYNLDYPKRLASIKNGLNMIICFDYLFQTMSLCSYEEYASNKIITPFLKRKKMELMLYSRKNNSVNFRLFGYSTKNNFNLRIYALNEAIKFYGISSVLRVLKKIQYFNLCLKQDYEYILTRKHLFQHYDGILHSTHSQDNDSYNKVTEGIRPDSINKKSIPATGLLVNEDYDNISHKTSLYFLKYNKFNSENEEINKKMKKIYEKLNECITY